MIPGRRGRGFEKNIRRKKPMSRTIAVMIPQLEENHRERIRKEAEGYGFETVFPKTAEETEQALKYIADARKLIK